MKRLFLGLLVGMVLLTGTACSSDSNHEHHKNHENHEHH
jgi:hypothetical protein